jgi:2,4-dichlorophenol 6-monooxygenase
VLLVRPDLYVAARHTSAPDSPESAAHWFRQALTSVLGTPFDAK